MINRTLTDISEYITTAPLQPDQRERWLSALDTAQEMVRQGKIMGASLLAGEKDLDLVGYEES